MFRTLSKLMTNNTGGYEVIFHKPCFAYADTAKSTITAITILVAIFAEK